MAIPKHLVSRVGRCEIKSMLKTTDLATAKMRAGLLSNALDALLRRLETMSEISTETINTHIRSYFQAALNRSLEHALLLPTDPCVDLDAEIATLRTQVQDLQKRLAHQTFTTQVLDTAQTILDAAPDLKAKAEMQVIALLCNGVLRADMENARILSNQLEGRYDQIAPLDPLFTGMAASGLPPLPGDIKPPAPDILTFKVLTERYLAFKNKEGWAKKTEADSCRAMSLAFEVIDPNKPVTAINANDVQAVRDLIAAVPPNFGKIKGNENLSAKEAAKFNSKQQFLSPPTQEKMLRFFKTILRWACDEGIIDKIPGEKVKIAGIKKLKAIDNRYPYSVDQLNRIFSSPAFTGHKSEGRRMEKGSVLVKDGKYWIPLIAIYSGLRAGEIVQLLKSDIRTEEAITYFDITKAEGDDKKLKTQSSFRKVPIHRALIEMGFLEFVSKVKPGGRIFPDIPFGKDGYPSHNWSKYWGRYTKAIKAATPKTAFHSFRHNFKDALQNAKAPEYIARVLMGHADSSVHGSYGSGPSLKLLKEEIDKVTFPSGLISGQVNAPPSKAAQ